MDNPYHIPFWIAYQLFLGWWYSPWEFKLIGGILTIGTLTVRTLKEEGPARVSALARRFSWAGYPLGAFVAFWLWQCSYPELSDNIDLWESFWVYITVLGWAIGTWFYLMVIRRGHLDSSILRRAYRRCRLRLRWDSIAKSALLSHIRDIRPKEWITGGTSATIGSIRVQWVPTLWRGRRLRMGDGVEYLIRPARGLDEVGIQEKLRAIGIAANGHSATLTELPTKKWLRNWWRLTIYWTDPAAKRPNLDWMLDDSMDNGGNSPSDTLRVVDASSRLRDKAA